jgi:glycosidase
MAERPLAALPRHPLLHQANTRVWLRRLSVDLGRRATLDDVPDGDLDRLASDGFDWLYLLGVWRTGTASREVSRREPTWRADYERILHDLTDDDICGSCFAIIGYGCHPDLGGDAALARLRTRLADRGVRLMLDFVPNHTALDHPWVVEHPERYIEGSVDDLHRHRDTYTRLGDRVLAYGRDPSFPGWQDTLQLDYSEPDVQAAMTDALLEVAGRCDGIRCDMAMLMLPDVFERTWGRRPEPFWPPAIAAVRSRFPSVVLLAEVYWGLERELLQQGFDLAYDKGLYDALEGQDAGAVRGHLQAGSDHQRHMTRFLENHDEARAAVVFPPDVHRAASLVTYLTPGLRFLHQGQREGHRLRISPHLCRGPAEAVDAELVDWYDGLLGLLRDPLVREGVWSLAGCEPLAAHEPADRVLAWTWRPAGAGGTRSRDGRLGLVVVVNYGPEPARCHVVAAFDGLRGATVDLLDRLTGDRSECDGDVLETDGLLVELPAWGAHVVEVLRVRRSVRTPGEGLP